MSEASHLRLTVNGKERQEAGPLTVRELLDLLGLPEQGVAVERNKLIVPKSEHATAQLEDGDVLEIVTLVGGG
jgi:sulfur carrier protein